MLKKQLEDYLLQLHVKFKTDEMDMDRLWNLYLDGTVTMDERKACINEYANVFWCLCIKWGGFSETVNLSRHINKMINFVSFFYAISSGKENGFYECKELVFIRFLAWLRDRKSFYNVNQDNKFYDFYRKLNDVIGQVKWVFELEDKGERVFPIHRLLDDAAIGFKLNEEHYLQVVFSLQLFNRIEKISDDKSSIRTKMLEIANEFHIHLIEMLCDGGELLYGGNAGINSAKNGTIVAILKDEILIRNIDKAYFSGDKCDFEGESEENAIAYYYTYRKKKNEMPQTFDYIMKHCPMVSKQMVLRELMKNKIYNVFLGEVFLVNTQTNMFTKVINIFSGNDDFIISGGNIVESKRTLYETFWSQIKREQNGLRTSTIAQSGSINVLTLDFIIEFSAELCSEENNCLEKLTEFNEEDFFQNQLLKVYFEEELHNGRIFPALRKYAKFLSDYMNINQVSIKTEFAQYPNLIMPYIIYVPFDGVIQNFFEALKKEGYIEEEVTLEELKAEVGIGNIYEYKVADEIIPDDKIYSIAGVKIENSRIKPGYCFFAREKKQIYVLGEYDDVIDVLNKISSVSSKYVINRQWLDRPTHLDRLIKIITNIGFDNVIYKNLGTVYKDTFVSNIALYKFLWLMQIFQFDKSKYEKFEELILNGFYCSFVLEPDKMMKKYLEEIEILSENNALIIAKEPDGVGATLNLMIERYSNGDRGSLRMAFDGYTINKNLKEHGGVYYYRNVPVKEIVFLTDNALSGKSTVDMLKYYLKGKRPSDDRRSYIFGKNLLPDILNKNADVKIIVKTIFYSERARKRIQREFPEYEISITGDMLASNSFQWTEEKNEVIRELFGNASETVHKNAQCVLRPCNLPYDQVLPDILKDPTKLIGIFRRKNH